MKAVHSQVAGVTFRDAYPENILSLLGRPELDHDFDDEPEGIRASLKRDPNNEYDPNAIEVHIPCLGKDSHVGFLPKALSEKLASRIDNGIHYTVRAVEVNINHDNPRQPGLHVKISESTNALAL